jgi:hypothetical protein
MTYKSREVKGQSSKVVVKRRFGPTKLEEVKRQLEKIRESFERFSQSTQIEFLFDLPTQVDVRVDVQTQDELIVEVSTQDKFVFDAPTQIEVPQPNVEQVDVPLPNVEQIGVPLPNVEQIGVPLPDVRPVDVSACVDEVDQHASNVNGYAALTPPNQVILILITIFLYIGSYLM